MQVESGKGTERDSLLSARPSGAGGGSSSSCARTSTSWSRQSSRAVPSAANRFVTFIRVEERISRGAKFGPSALGYQIAELSAGSMSTRFSDLFAPQPSAAGQQGLLLFPQRHRVASGRIRERRVRNGHAVPGVVPVAFECAQRLQAFSNCRSLNVPRNRPVSLFASCQLSLVLVDATRDRYSPIATSASPML